MDLLGFRVARMTRVDKVNDRMGGLRGTWASPFILPRPVP